MPVKSRRRAEYGDWQTPPALADAVLALLRDERPATVLEPTCGEGNFLEAAARRFPTARLHGYEINPEYVNRVHARVPHARARVRVADFFGVDWARELAALEDPILVTGNPPWVTNAELGKLKSENLPKKSNLKGLRGYDALTGKSNFDVSESMLIQLLAELKGRGATIAVICKSIVARRVIEYAWKERWPIAGGGLYRLDAMKHFGAAVDAVVLLAKCSSHFDPNARWPIHASLEGGPVLSRLGVVRGVAVANIDAFTDTEHLTLVGTAEVEWRSGVKHDCARVMEFRRDGARWINGFGDAVDVEETCLFPLLKGSDVANGRLTPKRAMLVTQRTLGEDTASLSGRAPRAWSYLEKHRALLDARRSSIYLRKPPFSIFGIGGYSFALWKVAISALHKELRFALIAPCEGRSVLLDDTCYFLPFADESSARRAATALDSPEARAFLSARVFWDSKRPIQKGVLQTLSLDAVEACRRNAIGSPYEVSRVLRALPPDV